MRGGKHHCIGLSGADRNDVVAASRTTACRLCAPQARLHKAGGDRDQCPGLVQVVGVGLALRHGPLGL